MLPWRLNVGESWGRKKQVSFLNEPKRVKPFPSPSVRNTEASWLLSLAGGDVVSAYPILRSRPKPVSRLVRLEVSWATAVG